MTLLGSLAQPDRAGLRRSNDRSGLSPGLRRCVAVRSGDTDPRHQDEVDARADQAHVSA